MLVELNPNRFALISAFIFPVLTVVLMIVVGIEGGLVLLTTLGILIYLFYFKFNLSLTVRFVLVTAFLLRVVIILLDQSLNILPYNWDDYYQTGLVIKENLVNQNPLFYHLQASLQVRIYSLVNALFYWVLGNHESVVRLFCAFWGILAVERIYRINKLIGLEATENLISIVVISFLPSFIIFSSLNMRDALIIFLSFDLLYRIVYVLNYNINRKAIIIIFDVIAIFLLRKLNIVLYITIILIFSMVQFIRKKENKLLWSVAVVAVVVAVFYYFQESTIMKFFLNYANREVQWRSSGGAVYLPGTVYHSYFDMFKSLPIRFFYFTFGPMPWQIDNTFMLFSFLESFFILIFLIGLQSITRFRENYTAILFILIFSLTALLANSVIDSNYGTAIRHKLNYIIPLIPLAAPFWKRLRI